MIVCEEKSNYYLLFSTPHHSKNVHSVPVYTMATISLKLTDSS